jgi:hypothetical protein
MDAWSASFGIGCYAALAVSLLSDDERATFIAMLCTVSWGASNIAWLFDAMGWLPVMDLAITLFALQMYRAAPARWLGWFTRLGFAQLGLHAVNEITNSGYIVAYLHMLNITFAAQLLAVGSTGVRDAASRSNMLSRLRDRVRARMSALRT